MPLDCMPTQADRIISIRTQAADLLERDGWCQNNWHDGRRKCWMGAIYDLLGFREGSIPDAPSLLNGVLASMGFTDSSLVEALREAVRWNDHVERTLPEVLNRLRGLA